MKKIGSLAGECTEREHVDSSDSKGASAEKSGGRKLLRGKEVQYRYV